MCSHLTHAFLGPTDSIPRTASRSVQPFLQGSRSWQTDGPTDHATPSVTIGRINVRLRLLITIIIYWRSFDRILSKVADVTRTTANAAVTCMAWLLNYAHFLPLEPICTVSIIHQWTSLSERSPNRWELVRSRVQHWPIGWLIMRETVFQYLTLHFLLILGASA